MRRWLLLGGFLWMLGLLVWVWSAARAEDDDRPAPPVVVACPADVDPPCPACVCPPAPADGCQAVRVTTQRVAWRGLVRRRTVALCPAP